MARRRAQSKKLSHRLYGSVTIYMELKSRQDIGRKKKMERLIMPAEEHDDAASDDVKPGLLLSQRPAEPSSLRHLPMAPHLHAGQRVEVPIPSSLSALSDGEEEWGREKGVGEQGGGPTPEALALAGACTAPVLWASGHAPLAAVRPASRESVEGPSTRMCALATLARSLRSVDCGGDGTLELFRGLFIRGSRRQIVKLLFEME
ncbi:hypothetical protein MUK42_37793 [Musa troglodytarum]|uniref:Uncharacterized protein n=1 Tax=Musa troglodytarum TaxID=320322 RepID=A0A9E7JC18_9LILI|nr:hypothetical protein MUK42_37793 [Musa troglodytarum]